MDPSDIINGILKGVSIGNNDVVYAYPNIASQNPTPIVFVGDGIVYNNTSGSSIDTRTLSVGAKYDRCFCIILGTIVLTEPSPPPPPPLNLIMNNNTNKIIQLDGYYIDSDINTVGLIYHSSNLDLELQAGNVSLLLPSNFSPPLVNNDTYNVLCVLLNSGY
jgi:hypothetical protein